MLRTFALCDGSLCGSGMRIGTLTYDTATRQFSMSINGDVQPDSLPLSLEGFAHRGLYELSHENAMRWVRGRICPPGRHNIREILLAHGLDEYDEFGLLAATKAKCDMDDLFLVEIPPPE